MLDGTDRGEEEGKDEEVRIARVTLYTIRTPLGGPGNCTRPQRSRRTGTAPERPVFRVKNIVEMQ
jgi:hypothetical protein